MTAQLKSARSLDYPSQSRSRRGRRIALVALGLAALAFLMGIPGGSDATSEEVAAVVEKLVISTRGHVEVTPGDEIAVTSVRNWGWLPHPGVSIDVDDGVLEVDGRCGYPWLLDAGCTTNVALTVPSDTPVEVRSKSGGISVRGMNAGVELTTSAGGIDVDGVAGPARLKTSAGAITGMIHGGEIEAVTSAGAIELEVTGSLESLSAVTSAGAIELKVPDEPYDVEFSTAAGEVDLDIQIDPDANQKFLARTSAGSIDIGRLEAES